MSHKYPSEVAVAFLEREAELTLKVQKFTARFNHTPDPQPWLPSALLTRLIETMFFASMVTEEGHFNPVGIVCAESIESFVSVRPAWDLVRFARAIPFAVEHVAKLAAACEWPRSFLAVVHQEQELVIAGIVTPYSRHFLDGDNLLRVLVPKPGVVAVCRGSWEVVRYERGEVRAFMSHDPPQLKFIQRAVLGEHPAALNNTVVRHIMRIVDGMVALGRGGLMAILGPDEQLEQLYGVTVPPDLEKEAKRLDPVLHFGNAITEKCGADLEDQSNNERQMLEGTPPTYDDELAAEYKQETSERVHRMQEQITRLTAVDGAVIMSHELNVLAFGAKLPRASAGISDVVTATADKNIEERWPLEARGTRHRAAAGFVAGYPKRIALIVSQDGNPATFQEIEGKIVYWPF
jgi:hypothetical protein